MINIFYIVYFVDEWMTDDLLSQIEKNETLVKKLQDPRFMEAVNLFQTNPTAAMERYKNDKETQDAFMQFCGLMGKHQWIMLKYFLSDTIRSKQTYSQPCFM